MKSTDPESRLARLERSNRLLTAAFSSAVLVLLLGAGSGEKRTVESLIVGDPAGRHLWLKDDGLGLFDSNQQLRALLSFGPENGVSLNLNDAAATPRVGMAVINGEPALSILDARGHSSAILSGSSLGTSFDIYDESGKKRAMIGFVRSAGMAGVAVWDADGKPLGTLPLR